MRPHKALSDVERKTLVLWFAACVVTLVCSFPFQSHQQRLAQEAFEGYTVRVLDQFRNRIELFQYGLRGARGAIITHGADTISLEDFRRYSRSRNVAEEFAGSRGFGFIRMVPADQTDQYIKDVTQRRGEPLATRQINPHDGTRMVIEFIEPEAPNRQAIGLDIASENNRRQAAEQAISMGKPVLTHPITLVQAKEHAREGFLLLLPVFPEGATPPTPETRQKQAIGFAYTPILIDEVMADFGHQQELVLLRISDQEANETFRQFYADANFGIAIDQAPVATHKLALFGRVWQIELQAKPLYVKQLNLISQIQFVLVGLVLSTLIAAIAFYLLSDRAKRNTIRMERARLFESEQRLKVMIDHAPAAIALLNTDLQTIASSRHWDTLFELQNFGRSDRPFFENLSKYPAYWSNQLQQALQGKSSKSAQDQVALKTGKALTLRWEVVPWLIEEGGVGGLILFAADITTEIEMQNSLQRMNVELERRVGERTFQLTEAQRTLQAVLNAIPSMIGYWDKHLRNRVANKAYREWFGVTPEALHGKHIKELLGPEIFEANLPMMQAALRGETQSFERTIPKPDGTGVRHSFAQYLPDVRDDGRIEGFYVVVHDISEIVESRNKLNAALQENSLLLSAIKAQMIFTTTDKNGVVLEVNDLFTERTGYTSEEIVGKTHRLISSGHHSVEFWADMWKTISHGKAWRGEICNLTKTGETVWLDTLIMPLVNAEGEIERYLGLRTDITAQRLASETLRQARIEAENANRAKSDFLANMSHEIRTPLNGVIGTAYILGKYEMPEEQQQLINRIQIASKALLAIVNDILDISKIEAGELKLEILPFSLEKLLTEVKEVFEPQAHAKGLSLELKGLSDIAGLTVRSDPTRLRQILFNLINNAIKFTPKGSVTLTVSARVNTDGPTQFRFDISDTGIGLTEESINKLFKPFTQADTSTTRKFGGSGLGLSIVKRLVDLMNGNVGVFSTLGEGSTFWIELDLPVVDNAKLQLELPEQPKLRVVLAEDNPIESEVIVRLGQSFGWKIDRVQNGRELVQLVTEQWRNQTLPDCLIVDWRMPEIDGLAALGELSNILGDKHLPSTIVITSYEIDELQANSNFHLADSLMVKPVGACHLFNEVNTAVSKHSGQMDMVLNATHLNDSLVNWLHDIRILLVDDSHLNLEVANAILHQEGATVVQRCVNGQEALDWFEHHHEEIDIVLLDVQMPVLDGNATVQLIRNHPKISHLPVVALTAGALSSEREKAISAGMDDYLTKPFDPDQMRRVIRKFVERYRQRLYPVSSKAMSQPGVDRRWATLAFADTAAVRDIFQNDFQFYLDSLSEFFHQFSNLPEITELSEVNEHHIHRLHDIAGSASLFGLATLAELAHSAERACVNQQQHADPTLLSKIQAVRIEFGKVFTQACHLPGFVK